MRILFYFIRWEGGVGRVISGLKKELERMGHEVKTLSREDNYDCYSTSEVWEHIRRDIKEMNKNNRYDVLITNDWSCALPLRNFKKHYCIFHGEETRFIPRMLQNYIAWVMGKRLIVVGDKLHKRFKKSNLMYNGYDPEEFKDLGKKRDKIGWIYRDYDLINEQDFKKICKKDYPHLKSTIAHKIPSNEMNEWYNQLKVFISLPPNYTGFNLCWLEALGSGVPEVIGNENGIGISKLKRDYKTMTWKDSAEALIKILEARK